MILTSLASMVGVLAATQWVTMTTRSGPRFGECVRVGDDVDRDGTPDVWVSSGRDIDQGLADAYVFSGVDGRVLQELRIRGRLGRVHRVEPLDDVDGDGLRDVVVFTDQRLYVHAGSDGHQIKGLVDLPSYPGGQVLVVDDVNEDGVRDFWMGCPAWPPWGEEGTPPRETALLLSGADGQVLRWIREPGADGNAEFGRGLALVGDQDGDDVDDLLVGAPKRGKGTVYVFSGRDGTPLGRVEGGSGGPCSSFGWPIVGLGDVDGDGTEDWAAGSVQLGCSPWDDEEEPSYVTAVSGAKREALWTLERWSAWNPFGFVLERVSASQLAIGFPAAFRDESGVLVVDPRAGSVSMRWSSSTLGLGRNEVTGSSLALLPSQDDAPSAVAAGGAVQIDDWVVYSGSVAVFEHDGTLRWARAARELYPRPGEPEPGAKISPPLLRARQSAKRPLERR